MIRIDRLQLRLPPGYEHRAATIVPLVAEILAGYSSTDPRDVSSLQVSPVQAAPGASDREVAEQVARGIATSLGARHE